jgi:signal transduction histidine kinase
VRQQLLRSTMLAVIVAVVVMGLPSIVALVWVATRSPVQIRDWLAPSSLPTIVGVSVAVTVALALVAVLLSVLVANRQARALATPLTELAQRAERLGAGESLIEPLDSGIAEVDRVSDVLSRSAVGLQRSLAAERDFASDASHQLRTPLTALLMRLEEIAATDEPEVVREEADIAITQVERLTRVVDDLMVRSRRPDASTPSVSLDSVIASLQREWQPAFEHARRSVHVQGERGLIVQTTPVALSQILSTLLENSLAHGRGTVEVSARRSGPSVVVEVGDQGEGVPQPIAPHIFERSVSTKSTGLGLALARDLAEKNGGRLELVNAQPAVFALFLSEAERQ